MQICPINIDGKGQKISETNYHTRTTITRGLYTFCQLFEVHLCTVTLTLCMVSIQAVSNQEQVIEASVG